VRAGGRVLPVSEIELELKAGHSDALFDLALFLAERLPLLPLDASKAGRGAMLARGMAPAPVKATALALARDMIAEDGFAAIGAACLGQFQANLPGLLLPLPNPPPPQPSPQMGEGANAGPKAMASPPPLQPSPQMGEGANAGPKAIDDDPEYLHQARVALRRLRAGLRLYRNSCALPADELQAGELQTGLRALAAALGPARDWDVLCLETLPAIQPYFTDAGEWEHFAAAAQARRRAMRQEMLCAIRLANPGRWLLQFHRWLAAHGWRENPASRLAQLDTLTRFAAQSLQQGRRRIRRLGRDFSRLSPEQRHALRIAIKRQRYAAEFFRNLYPDQAGARYVRALALAQDALGRANDARVARDRLHDMRDSGCAFAVGFADGWLARQALETPPRKIARQVQALMQWKRYW
jgi:CHAD domain-containing protein